jgi:quinolinate synthase
VTDFGRCHRRPSLRRRLRRGPRCLSARLNSLRSGANGSTEFIAKTIANAPAGSAWAVGTEINLVSRLAKENPDKTVFCLDPVVCPCSTMYRVHPA